MQAGFFFSIVLSAQAIFLVMSWDLILVKFCVLEHNSCKIWFALLCLFVCCQEGLLYFFLFEYLFENILFPNA